MRNIILIGMPGSGKSTFGRKLAARLGRDFVDCDDFIEAEEGTTIPALFAVSEDHFRDAETRAVVKLAGRDSLIIAAGGGVIKRKENIEALRKTGTILFLDRAPEDIASDVDVSYRPLLKDGPARLYSMYEERIEGYRAAADVIVKNHATEEEVLNAIVAIVENKEK